MKYIAFNKPFQVLSQFTQPENSDKRTLSEFGFPKEVYPVGRLDYDSEGLLLLSDDGRFIKELLDPNEAHPRIYLVQVENIPDKNALSQLQRGIVIDGRKTRPAGAELLQEEPDLPPRPVPIRVRKNIPTSWIELTLTEGRNRQVRKMTAAVGSPTLRLIRWAISDLNLDDLGIAPGEWVYLEDEQLDLLL
jgi:23S rRNA pseudouridine2457 synthase